MIDFIKILYRNKRNFEAFLLKDGNFEDVYQTLESHTSEITYPYKAVYGNMDFVACGKTAYIKNSLHKFYNAMGVGTEHNYNDFTYSMLNTSINLLLIKMVDVEESRITQLEFGLNIRTSIPAEEMIRENILMHNLKGFNHNRKYYGKGELKQFDHDNYFIKIYDKAKQYNLNYNLLRFELKFRKARGYQEAGVFNLLDLKDKSKLTALFYILLKRFDELTIVDEVENMNQWDNDDRINFIKYQNPRFWESLTEQDKRQTKSRYKKNFYRILNEYNLNKMKQELRNQLIEKFYYLINN